MNTDNRFLGICIFAASLILAAAILYHARAGQVGRYQLQQSNPPGVVYVIDTTSGEYTVK